MFGCLPSRDRQILLLLAVEGLRYSEIAQYMGLTVGTVKSRISRARSRLRKLQAGTSGNKTGSPTDGVRDDAGRAASRMGRDQLSTTVTNEKHGCGRGLANKK